MGETFLKSPNVLQMIYWCLSYFLLILLLKHFEASQVLSFFIIKFFSEFDKHFQKPKGNYLVVY